MMPRIPCAWAPVALLCSGMIACGAGGGSTRVTFEVEVAGQSQPELRNDHGHVVTLTRASIHLGPVYFFSGEPLFSRQGESLPRRLVRLALGVGVAHAHPGHYQEGDALAELLTAATFDLLSDTPVRLGVATGVSGPYRSAQVNLGPAPDGPTVVVAGTARKDGREVHFSGSLSLREEVRGIAIGADLSPAPGRVRLEIDLGSWLERVDFSALDDSAPVVFQPGSQAENALQRGVVNTSAFVLSAP